MASATDPRHFSFTPSTDAINKAGRSLSLPLIKVTFSGLRTVLSVGFGLMKRIVRTSGYTNVFPSSSNKALNKSVSTPHNSLRTRSTAGFPDVTGHEN